MKYEKFRDILNSKIFAEAKKDLLEKIAKYPERYIGLFRPTKPKGKILQNLTQSAEIRFGDAFEVIIEEYFKENGFISLDKNIKDGKDYYNLDQLFKNGNTLIFIEQKIRDDHDSSKKRGQIDNFIRKIEVLQEAYDGFKIKAFFYFIDDSLTKNKNYYYDEIEKIKNDYEIDCNLYYGKELFEYFNIEKSWEEIIKYLKKWKEEILDLPEINFDKDVKNNLQEIKDISPNIFRKLFSREDIFKDILLTLSPDKKFLLALCEYFKIKGKDKKIYNVLYNQLSELLK